MIVLWRVWWLKVSISAVPPAKPTGLPSRLSIPKKCRLRGMEDCERGESVQRMGRKLVKEYEGEYAGEQVCVTAE